MKFKPLLIISYMLLVLFTAACDMFTNDPGKVQNGSADVAIAVVNAPFSATLGEMVDIDISLENRGSKPVTDDITITFSDETNDSTLATFVHSGGLTVDSSAAVFLQWEVNGEPENKNLRISHDFSDSNTENNTASFAIAINDQQQEDIAITRFNVPSEIERGQAAEIELRVTNTGVDTINDEVSITLTNLTTGDIIGQETIDPGFEAGSSTSFLIQMPTGSLNPGEFTIEASHNFEDNTPDNNTGTRSITVTEPDIPDESNIGISSINVTTSASQGEIVDIEVIIENSGNNDVNSAFEITLVDETDGNSIETQQIEGGINAGESTGRTFSWNTENASLEEHTLVVSHSFDDGSTADNAASANITITEPEIADIGITEFSGPSEITQGEEANFSLIIANQSDLTAALQINIRLYNATDEVQLPYQNHINEGFEGGGERTFGINWDTEDASVGVHIIIARHDFEDGNSNNNSDTLTVIVNAELTIENIDPDEIERGDTENATITGTGFLEGLQIHFSRDDNDESNGRPIASDIEVVDSNTINFTVSTNSGRQRGDADWDVIITNPNGDVAVLANGFTVEDD